MILLFNEAFHFFVNVDVKICAFSYWHPVRFDPFVGHYTSEFSSKLLSKSASLEGTLFQWFAIAIASHQARQPQ